MVVTYRLKSLAAAAKPMQIFKAILHRPFTSTSDKSTTGEVEHGNHAIKANQLMDY